ncbi:hypothetical protein DF186_24750, partial [Enterococcus hirae]
ARSPGRAGSRPGAPDNPAAVRRRGPPAGSRAEAGTGARASDPGVDRDTEPLEPVAVLVDQRLGQIEAQRPDRGIPEQ